jgi:excisionase family DNA binding protein
MGGEIDMAVSTVNDVQALPAILTVEELRQLLGVSRPVAYDLTHRKGFPAVRFGRAIRIPRDAFLRWLDAQSEEELIVNQRVVKDRITL